MGIFSWIKGKLGGAGNGTVSGGLPRLLTVDGSVQLSSASLSTNAVYQAAAQRFASILSKVDLQVVYRGKEVHDRPDLERVFNYKPNELDPDAISFRKQFFGSLFNNFIALAWLEFDYSATPARLKNIWFIDPTSEDYKVGFDPKSKKVLITFKWEKKIITVYEDEVLAIPFFPTCDNPFGTPEQKKALQGILDLIENNFTGLAKTIANANALRFIAKSPQPLTDSAIKNRQEKLNNQLFKVDNMGIMYIDGASEMIQVNNTAPWTGTDEAAKQEAHIYEFLGIPKGVVDGSASDDVYQSFIEMSVEPLTMQMSRQLTCKLLTTAEFNRSKRIEFSTSDLFTASQTHRQQAASVLITSGRYYPNEIRSVMGLPLLEDKDNTVIDRIDRIDTSKEKENANETGKESHE